MYVIKLGIHVHLSSDSKHVNGEAKLTEWRRLCQTLSIAIHYNVGLFVTRPAW